MKKLFMMAAVLGAFTLSTHAAMADNHDGQGHKGKMMERYDTDGDGKMSKSEFMAKHEAMFMKMDKDGDGYLSKEEKKDGRKKMHEKMKDMREKRQERKESMSE